MKEIEEALVKLPNYEGTVYRGLGIEKGGLKSFLSEYKKGNVVEFKTFASSSQRRGIANRFAKRIREGEKKKPYILEIKSKTGGKIESGGGYSGKGVDEKEVLIRRGTRFRIMDKKGDIIYLEEL